MSFLRVAEQVLWGNTNSSKDGLRDRGGRETLSTDSGIVFSSRFGSSISKTLL